MKIAIGSDHAAFEFKEQIKPFVEGLGHTVEDCGTWSTERADYPDFGIKVGELVSAGKADRGIVCCGTGIGMSIACNKVKGVRCALCNDPFLAKLSREHNDANVLAMGARIIDVETAKKIVEVWLSTDFSGGRHSGRIKKISDYEAISPSSPSQQSDHSSQE